MSPDLDAAANYAAQRLACELVAKFTYHNAEHTTADVVPAVARLATGEGVTGRDLVLVLTGAWFHDIGFVERSQGHELIGVRFAQATLPQFGYDEGAVAVVRSLIMATRLPQSPATALEAILCDADLDVLGRDDFFARNEALRTERAAEGQELSPTAWWQEQAEFVAAHQYFTPSAHRLRDAGKARNLKRLCQLADARP